MINAEMATTGYSGNPLIKKLGYKPGDSVCTVGEPEWFEKLLYDSQVFNSRSLPANWLHIFVTSRDELIDTLKSLSKKSIEKGIWISWPKGSTAMIGGINENTVREVVLSNIWVDKKVCSIDEIWSGLKFVRRKK